MYKCVIIEDEPLAAELLADYLKEVPDFELVAHCRDVMTASSVLRNEVVDVLFVDIHLPKVKGIDFIRSIQNQYQVILTTAYDHYAIEGFNLNVVDYLLKPIEFSRFLQALQKVSRNSSQSVAGSVQPAGDIRDRSQSSAESETAVGSDPAYRYFNVDRKQVRVMFDDILFIESLKEYIRIHTTQGRLVTKMGIGEAETLFGSHDFIRVHKSFIVNLKRVTAYHALGVDVEGKEIPVGRSFKEKVMGRLG